MRTTLLVLAFLVSGCARLVHVPPAPREEVARDSTVVSLYVTCQEPYPFKNGDPDDPHKWDPDVVWVPSKTGTGVIVSERHVLTAEHVVNCPIIPRVKATLTDGRVFQLWVDRDDVLFGDGGDLARLVIATDETFNIDIAPPLLRRLEPQEQATAVVFRHGKPTEIQGTYSGGFGIIDDMTTRKGDSGAPVYGESGQLGGLIVEGAKTGSGSKILPVDASWSEGL